MEIYFTCMYAFFICIWSGGVREAHISSPPYFSGATASYSEDPESLRISEPGSRSASQVLQSLSCNSEEGIQASLRPKTHSKHCYSMLCSKTTLQHPRKAAISFPEPTRCFLPGKRHQPWTQFKRRTGSSVVGSQLPELDGGWGTWEMCSGVWMQVIHIFVCDGTARVHHLLYVHNSLSKLMF